MREGLNAHGEGSQPSRSRDDACQLKRQALDGDSSLLLYCNVQQRVTVVEKAESGGGSGQPRAVRLQR